MNDYNFSWDQLGDLKTGRPNLGLNTTVEMYRLMQFTLRAVLEKNYGMEVANQLLIDAGRLAGVEFCKQNLDISLPLKSFIAQIHEAFLKHSIGILRVEEMDVEKLNFILTCSEDLDCSGLPITGFTVCKYDEGFFEGIFNTYTQKEFMVKEIDCWSTGDRTCRFQISVK